MTKALTNVTTGSALSRAIADTDARSWVARQLRFEHLLRSLEQESVAASANPSSD